MDDVAQRVAWNQAASEVYALPTETWREVLARHRRYQQVRSLLLEGQMTSVNDLITSMAGSISAEHGIGTLKRAFLDRSRTAQELAAMRLIKRALDPANILNPGKILMPVTSAPTAST